MIEDDLKHTLDTMRAVPAVHNALTVLKEQLPKELYYHGAAHTDDVLSEVLRFALIDKVSPRELELLAIAAACHDIGFIKSPVMNEPLGAAHARAEMSKAGGYSEEEIALVERMILDTALVESGVGPKQIPSTNLSRYLLDADLSNFGRDDFFDKGELQRKELGVDQGVFRRNSLSLLNAHRWLTNAAMSLRQKKKEQNLSLLKSMVFSDGKTSGLGFDRLGFLAKLPTLLNSSLDTQKVLKIALGELKARLDATAATIFLLDEDGKTLTFWALQGSENHRLAGTEIPADMGIVGWVIQNQEALIIKDASTDPRFFSGIDKEGGFTTRSMVCAPLSVREHSKLGAVQVLNKLSGVFSQEDLEFVTQFSHQVALAIENAQLYEAVALRSKQLELVDSRKNELMSLLAAEFRDPVSMIGTSAELLGSGALNDGFMVEKTCLALSTGVQRLSKLIADFRNLSLASSSLPLVHRERCLMQSIIRQALGSFQSVLPQREISVAMECPESIGHVDGDFNLLVIAVGNLISNAIRFTPDRGNFVIKGSRVDGFVTVEVSDHGRGMSVQEAARVFDGLAELPLPHERAASSYEFNSRGLGLGLPATKNILQAHGTQLEVRTKTGDGCSFFFSLPVAQ
jgi:signal transduction histidine kinase